jgi:phage baseplate assembly protein W
MSVIVTGSIDSATSKRISRLFTTPVGSVPFDRNFGVDLSSLDNVPAALEGALMVEQQNA